MRIFLTTFLFFIAVAVSAQSCTLTNDADFCTTCASLISGGVISGTITVPNNAGNETLPSVCGTTPLTIGALTIDVGTNANLQIDGAIGIDMDTDLSLTGNGQATIEIDGVSFSIREMEPPTFTDLANAVMTCADSPDCENMMGATLILPVELLSWDATRTKDGDVIATWTVASEEANAGYRLERGTSPDNLREVAQILPVRPGADGVFRYEFTDPSPGAAMLYYRLSQVDHDGTVASFNLVTVASAGLTLFPNPSFVGAEVRTNLPDATVRLRSLSGQLIGEYTTSAVGRFVLPAELKTGVYFLTVNGQTQRLVVR